MEYSLAVFFIGNKVLKPSRLAEEDEASFKTCKEADAEGSLSKIIEATLLSPEYKDKGDKYEPS